MKRLVSQFETKIQFYDTMLQMRLEENERQNEELTQVVEAFSEADAKLKELSSEEQPKFFKVPQPMTIKAEQRILKWFKIKETPDELAERNAKLQEAVTPGGDVYKTNIKTVENQLFSFRSKLLKYRSLQIEITSEVPSLIMGIQAREYDLQRKAGAVDGKRKAKAELSKLEKQEAKIKAQKQLLRIQQQAQSVQQTLHGITASDILAIGDDKQSMKSLKVRQPTAQCQDEDGKVLEEFEVSISQLVYIVINISSCIGA